VELVSKSGTLVLSHVILQPRSNFKDILG